MYFYTKEMNVNAFVETRLPSKREIFARTGQRAVSPAGSFGGDDPVKIGQSPTELAEGLVRSAESYKTPEDLPE